uniref:Ovate family protein n=1 Tax=Steinernema glaseri TaxID=37863 RepID=A0A1I8AKU3_9BILA
MSKRKRFFHFLFSKIRGKKSSKKTKKKSKQAISNLSTSDDDTPRRTASCPPLFVRTQGTSCSAFPAKERPRFSRLNRTCGDIDVTDALPFASLRISSPSSSFAIRTFRRRAPQPPATPPHGNLIVEKALRAHKNGQNTRANNHLSSKSDSHMYRPSLNCSLDPELIRAIFRRRASMREDEHDDDDANYSDDDF